MLSSGATFGGGDGGCLLVDGASLLVISGMNKPRWWLVVDAIAIIKHDLYYECVLISSHVYLNRKTHHIIMTYKINLCVRGIYHTAKDI